MVKIGLLLKHYRSAKFQYFELVDDLVMTLLTLKDKQSIFYIKKGRNIDSSYCLQTASLHLALKAQGCRTV